MHFQVRRAEDEIAAGEPREARRLLEKHLQHIPRDAEAWLLLSYARPERRFRADCLRKALQFRPEYVEAQRDLNYIESLPPRLTRAQRAEMLGMEIGYYLQHGWRVQSKTDTSAQLVRQKGFSKSACCLFGLFYVAKRAGDPDKTLFLEVTEKGDVNIY